MPTPRGWRGVRLPFRRLTFEHSYELFGIHEYRDGIRVTFLSSQNTYLSSLDTDPLDAALHHWPDALYRQLIVMDKRLHRRMG